MTRNDEEKPKPTPPLCTASQPPAADLKSAKEWGAGQGPEPTRYGDWELRGRCIDF